MLFAAMSRFGYHTSVYRFVYAAICLGVYLLLSTYFLSGDGGSSDDNWAVWRLLMGMALVAMVGAWVGPVLHRHWFNRSSRLRSGARQGKRTNR